MDDEEIPRSVLEARLSYYQNRALDGEQRLAAAEARVAELEKESLSGLSRRLLEESLAAAEADRDALLAEIQKWREGRAYLGVPMTYVDQRLVDETRRYIGDRRAAGVKP